jgi:Uma2 family endonuclease
MVAATPPKLTIEEFFKLHGHESNVELIRGQIVRYPIPGSKHGSVCTNAAVVLSEFVRTNKLGRVMSNDTLIRLTNDTTRGADVCYVSYAKLPKEQPLPEGVLGVSPELVIEVRSPSDLWTDAMTKAIDYIRAGATVVVILDPKTESASVYRSEARQDIFENDEALTIPDVLPGFAVPVSRFFEE